jgi:hypothetical protein
MSLTSFQFKLGRLAPNRRQAKRFLSACGNLDGLAAGARREPTDEPADQAKAGSPKAARQNQRAVFIALRWNAASRHR